MQELMKKIVYAIAALALIFTGCAKELENTTKENFSVVRLRVTVADDATKVSADNDGRYHWQAGDKISVLNNSGKAFEFETEEGGAEVDFGATSFTGTLGSYAMYPSVSSNEAAGDVVSFHLPTTIDWVANATNMPMLGKIDENKATFRSVGGVLKLVCYNIPSGAAWLQFTATSQKIVGEFVIDGSEALPVLKTENTEEAGKKELSIDFSGNYSSNMVFYIPLPTGTINGFTVAFLDSELNELFSKTTDAAPTVARNQMIIAPALNCTGVADAVLTNAEILAVITGSYTSKDISSASGTWSYANGMKQASKLQLKKQTDSGKLTLPSTFTSNISKIVLEGTGNGGGSAFSGTVYFKNTSTDETIVSKTVSDISLGDNITIDVPSGHTTGYITADGVIRIASVTVKFVNAGTFPSLTATDDDLEIAVGSLTATTTVSLSNPVDALGISCVVNEEAKSWLSASISGSTLTVTAAEANSTATDRNGTVTLKATGAANVVISVTQPTKIVANPTVTATAGDSKFTATWAGVPHASNYVAYLHTAPTATPATGGTDITASISESAGTYSITDYAVTNDTHYYLYVKVDEVDSEYEAISDYVVKDFTPAEAKGTAENPYWASEAYDYISTFGSGKGPDDPIYVKGYVCSADAPNSTYHNQTYYISDDGTTTKQFEVYRGKGISGADITSSNRVNVGDYVVVSGIAINYNGTKPEFEADSKIITHNPKLTAPTFSVAEGTYYTTQNVSLSAADGATIYYTTDGSEPTSASSSYSTPLSISSTTTVKALAVKADCVDSEVASATYTIKAPTQLVMSTITCSAQTGSSLTFTWTAVTNATGYQVSLDGGTNWETKQNGVSYTWTGLMPSTLYTIKVKAIGTDNGQYTDSEPGSASGTTTAGGGGFTPFNVWEDSFSNCSSSSSALTSLSGSTAGFTGGYSGISATYPMDGAIRIGKASGSGSITTPVLASISGASVCLTVSFKAAGWNGKTAKLTLSVNKGAVTEGQTTIDSEASMAGNTPTMTGKAYTFHITDADNTTKITFSTTNSIGIDDLVITQTTD